jgi:cytochrome P450
MFLGVVRRVRRGFEDPNRFDASRSPNHHFAFDFDQHFCVGKQLALMETRISLVSLFDRNPSLRLAVPPAELAIAPGWHRYERLLVVLGEGRVV